MGLWESGRERGSFGRRGQFRAALVAELVSEAVIIEGVNDVGAEAGWRAVNAARSNARWRDLPPTDAQRRTLRKLGMPEAPRTRGEASQTISARLDARYGRSRFGATR